MDIREIYKSLSPDDRLLYSRIRTDMRRLYINAHTTIVKIQNWAVDDDAFLDLIDIKLATLFDRAGLMATTKEVIHKEDAKDIEEEINKAGVTASDRLKAYDPDAWTNGNGK
jgi:hypothetical protein